MYILGINGSRRPHGNTRCLLDQALEGARREGARVELVQLGDLEIRPCTGCEGCRETMQCVQEDDMGWLLERLLAASALVLGSPTYYYNVTADFKAFVDRTYSLTAFDPEDRACWVALPEALGGKYAVLVGVCEQEQASDMGFTLQAMEAAVDSLGYRTVARVEAIGHFAAGSAGQDHQLLERAGKAGERLARTVQLRQRLEQRIKGGFS